MVILVLIGVIIVIAIIISNSNSAKRKELWTAYQQAIASGDKRTALLAGRNYYAKLRTDGKLTMYDEQALSNDLSTM